MQSTALVEDEDVREKLRTLLAELERGNGQEAGALLDQITRLRETELFHEMGKITRELHQALNSVHADTELTELAEHEIPDAMKRLDFVVATTDEAAHRTLGLLEETVPISEGLAARARKIRADWSRFGRREMEADEFRHLVQDVDTFLAGIESDTERLQSKISEIMLAQSFQDITGQIIGRVIELVREVEGNLVKVVRMGSAGAAVPAAARTRGKGEDDLKPAGPTVPGTRTGDVIRGQDEVDDLLSELGF